MLFKMLKGQNSQFHLPHLQESLTSLPHLGIKRDLKKIYKDNSILLGWPSSAKVSGGKSKKEPRIFDHLARPNTVAIIGAALGDEGKGRLVDNKIKELLKKPGVKNVIVVRFQGGNNAGHTLEKDGIKLALHLVPAGVFYKQAIGIMDRGMAIHPEDLQTEIEYIEKITGSLKGKLFLSEEAILCTDLERAEEVLNRVKEGKARGGTGRGIAPAYAHHYDRLGLKIYDLLDKSWKEKLSYYYDRYKKEFAAYDINVAEIDVPDFKTSHKVKKGILKKVGNKKEFLERLEKARNFIIKRKIVTNTFLIHQAIFADKSKAVLFEGSQAVGLDPWLGTRPDVTSSNTTCFGLREGTAFWTPQMVEERLGIFKIPYTSSVGARCMPTHVDLPKDLNELNGKATEDQKWAAYVREEAHEYGTTTGRPRDINFLDLEFIKYNARMSGIEMLAGTHLDIAKDSQIIKVCTHYTDKKGNQIHYQPGLRYSKDIIPNYVELPGWDGKACQKAKKLEDLPENAVKFLSFIQARTGFPIVATTSGPGRENIINFS